MLYDVLVVSTDGGEQRFTIERDAPLSVGDIFEPDSESYRVIAVQPGHGPLRASSKPSGLGSPGPCEFAPCGSPGGRGASS
jgi:hypothetical protein